MAAGSIVIDLLMKTGSFETDTKRAEKRLKEFEATAKKTALAVTAVAAAAVAGFAAMVNRTTRNMDEMAKMARQVGVTTEALSSLSYAAKLSGVEQNNLTQSLARLSKGMVDAANGTGEAKKAFDALGINASTMKSADEALVQIADRFSTMEDGAQKTALAMQLFGRSGAQLIPFLNQGRDGISAVQKEADRLGITLSTKTGIAAEQFRDNMFRMQSVATGLFNTLSASILPALVALTEKMFEAAVETSEADSELTNLTGNQAPAWLKGLAISFATVADAAVLAFTAIGAGGNILDGFGAKIDYNLARFKRFAVSLAKTPLIGEPSEAVKKELENLDSQVFKLGMTALDAHQKVNDIFSRPMSMPLSSMIRESFEEGSEPIFPRTTAVGFSPSTSTSTSAAKSSSNQFISELSSHAQAYNDFINEITGRTEAARLEQQQAWLETARFVGDISQVEYESAIAQLVKVEKHMSEFAIQSARNIQNILGDGLYKALSGNFKNIGSAFQEMLKRMLADLAASQLAQALFGSLGTTGQMGGLAGTIGKVIGAAIGGMSGGVTTPSDFNAGGFSMGGYTGMGGKYEPAGVVHRGEYVLNADATKKLGVGFLDRLNKGYANGGYVGASSSAMGGNVNINIKNEAGADGYQASAQAKRNTDGGLNIDVLVRRIVSADIQNNGALSQQMANTFSLRRSI